MTQIPKPDSRVLRVGVFGTGAIGGYVGGRLAAAGYPVVLVGRDAAMTAIRDKGLRVTDLDGFDQTVPCGDRLRVGSKPEDLASVDVVLLTVKSQDSESSAASLASHLKADAAIVSLQNGVRNVETLAKALPRAKIIGGMVPFSAEVSAPGHYHRGSGGRVMLDADPASAAFGQALASAGVSVDRRGDMVGVQWGKLVFNLNNAVNALAGVPLVEELGQRGYRRVLAAAMTEAMATLARAGIKPSSVLKFPPAVVPPVLRSPDWLYKRLAKSMLAVDPTAKSSMLQDFERGRPTEIEYLCGEVVRLAKRHGGEAPINARLVELVRAAEQGRKGSPKMSAAELERQVLRKV